MAFDLNDAWGWIQKLIARVSRLESGAMLENSSITGGRMRFIGGTLRVDSGGRIELEGILQGGGTILWTGTITNNGVFTNNGQLIQIGPWELKGNGTISGNAIISGTLNVTGNSAFGGTLAILGVTTLSNDLIVQSGGKIKAGNIEITPSENGGTIKVGAHTIYVSGDVLNIRHSSGNQVVLNSSGASLIAGSRNLTVRDTGISGSLPTRNTTAYPGSFVGAVVADTSGALFRIVAP